MKKAIRKILLSFMILLMSTTIIDMQAAGVGMINLSEQFPDDGMQKVVRKVMNLEDDIEEVSIEDFKQVTSFVYDGRNTPVASKIQIASLKGISLFGNLKTLSLNSVNLTEVNPEIGNLANLEKLALYNSQVKELPLSIGNLSKLKSLDIKYSQLASLPETIGNLKTLETLDFSDNKLTSLPKSIGGLEKLIDLNLRKNQIEKLPEEICGLSNLKFLDVEENKLINLPEEIGDLLKLEGLYVEQNKLINLPNSIGKLERLQELTLSRNQITSIPQSLENLRVLKYVTITHNSLSDVTIEQIKSIQSREILYSDQRYTLENKGIVGHSYPIKMTTLMKSFHAEGLLDTMIVELHKYTDEVDKYGDKKTEFIATLNSNVADFEKGILTVPQENFTIAGQYAVVIVSEINSKIYNNFIYSFEMKDVDLSFSGLPEKVEVGDTFSLIPSVDDQQGSAGWEWDNNAFDATFNSPATFVAKKGGLTTITYKTALGYPITTEIDVKEKPYEVTFDSNGGSGNMDAITYIYDEVKPLTKNTFVRKDYLFEGWAVSKEDANLRKVSHKDQSDYQLSSRSNQVLYAVWKPIQIEVTGMPEIIQIDESFEVLLNIEQLGSLKYDEQFFEVISNDTKVLPIGNKVKFKALKAGTTSVVFVSSNGSKVEKSIEIRENYYSVMFDSNGGAGNMTEVKYAFNEETALPKNEFNKEGYVFEGWALSREDASSKNVSFLNEALYKLETKEATTLYAVWSAIEIQLSTLPESIFVGNEFAVTTNVKGTWSYDATMLEIVETNEKSTVFRALKVGDIELTFHAENGEETKVDLQIKEVVEIQETEKPKHPNTPSGGANATETTTKSSVPATGDVHNVVQLFGVLILSLLAISTKLKKASK